jgi:hypothetical protein
MPQQAASDTEEMQKTLVELKLSNDGGKGKREETAARNLAQATAFLEKTPERWRRYLPAACGTWSSPGSGASPKPPTR